MVFEKRIQRPAEVRLLEILGGLRTFQVISGLFRSVSAEFQRDFR